MSALIAARKLRTDGNHPARIARLEGGGSKPSTRTLQRDAEASGSRLQITFEPKNKRLKTVANRAPM